MGSIKSRLSDFLLTDYEQAQLAHITYIMEATFENEHTLELVGESHSAVAAINQSMFYAM